MGYQFHITHLENNRVSGENFVVTVNVLSSFCQAHKDEKKSYSQKMLTKCFATSIWGLTADVAPNKKWSAIFGKKLLWLLLDENESYL